MRLFFLILLGTVMLWSCETDQATTENTTPPAAKKVDFTFTEHGNERIDPYQWLSNSEDPEVIAHLKAENAFVEAQMAHTKELQESIYDELVSRIEQKYESLPTKKNGYWYYVRYDEGNEYPYYCRKKGSLEAEEEIILNVNEMAEGYQIYRLFQYFVSPDNQMVAYLVDTSGDRRNTLYFKNLKTGELLPDQVSNCSYGGAWSSDGTHFFYTLNDHAVRTHQVKKHQMGQDISNDVLMYEEPDSTFSAYIYKSWDDQYIFFASGSSTSNEFHFLPADQPNANLTLIQKREKDLEFSVNSYYEDVFYIYNNDGAENFKLSSAPVSSPGKSNWQDVVPENPEGLMTGYEIRADFIVIEEKFNAVDQIKVIDRRTQDAYYVDFGEEVYTASMYSPTDEYEADSIRYTYNSLSTPRSTFGYNLNSQERRLLKQANVGGGFDASLYETKRLWVTAQDGTKVPVSMVYRKDKYKQDGTHPGYLYAYGSYGSSTSPYFRSNVISLLDRGFVYAIAHIRGGQEMGRAWYEDGKLLNKKNTFTDFVDCSQYLVNEGYVSKEGLYAGGGSAGGMLMGAVVNLRPDLYRGIIAYVPWMDVITDMMNTDLPLTTLEYQEWGDPNDKTYYDYMLSWSPYDNVKPAAYPAIFATGGLNDTQVPYFSPAKWVQKIRENNTGDAPILFKCNMGAGHGGESGRFAAQKETAEIYAFMIDQLELPMKN